MASIRPDIITYASCPQTSDMAVSAGATHLILDDPAISIRSFVPPRPFDDFQALSTLIIYCRHHYPSLLLSVNCDCLIHTHHEPFLLSLIDCLTHTPVDFIRIQDVGLIDFFKQALSIPVIYHAEMGNINWLSVQTLSDSCSRQLISNECPVSDIKLIQKNVSTDLDIHVQGALLIQYSHRRFLAGLDPEVQNPDHLTMIHRLAQDDDYPGRHFTFLDSPHGHFMFAYFDRCLMTYFSDLMSLQLSGWIIDGRGQSHDYLTCSLQAYATCLHQALLNQLTSEITSYWYSKIQSVSKRPQKPGFFRANQTDQRRYKKSIAPDPDHYQVIGRVVDVCSKKRLIIYCEAPFSIHHSPLFAFHPKLEAFAVPCTHIWDMSNTPILHCQPDDLIQIPWIKGIQQHAVLCLQTPSQPL